MTPLLTAAVMALSLGACRGDSPPAAAPGPPLPPVVHGTMKVDTVAFGRFGPVVLYRTSTHPARVVIFISGDGGWNHGVVAMARALASLDALVVGVDIRRYFSSLERSGGPCAYPPADFEALSQGMQRRLGFPAYVPPVLVGYSSGATLVYATLVQAPPGTFRGGVSLSFCPDLWLDRKLCRGSGLSWRPGRHAHEVMLAAADSMETPWVVLQGADDSTCSVTAAEQFVSRIRGARMVRLSGVGHGFGVQSHWMPAFRDAFEQLTGTSMAGAPAAPEVHDLPLIELPARGGSGMLAVVVSGDGGWASIDRRIGETLQARGVSVVGLNALQYFWHARTPDESSRDLARVLRHYLAAWHLGDVLLVGYSMGAEVLPFMASRLPADLRARVRLVALLAPSRTASFEFHLSELLGGSQGDRPTAPEIERLRGLRVLCLYGTDDKDSVCPALPPGAATVVPVEGGHHFGRSYVGLADRILRAAESGEEAQQQRVGPGP
ncbi:MAG TPA: AcvB/VirJ family lysyl-phosphatidylglycerol hydrolase [Gemmatimonadales bacterium]